MIEENGKLLFAESWVSHTNMRLYRLREKKIAIEYEEGHLIMMKTPTHQKDMTIKFYKT